MSIVHVHDCSNGASLNACPVIERGKVSRSIRFIAFYLPQFHPIPENNCWWGNGFTEWTNVTRALPLFKGHSQPRVPADLGYYDLRVPETRIAQAELASNYGIDGFCYWHYWFNGKRLLERPFDEVLGSGEPKFPFCLAWANESWSRRWLGEDKEILIEQTYNETDDINHSRWLINTFADSRYIKTDNRPLFVIYRPRDFPNPPKTIEILRNECTKAGLANPYLLASDAHCYNFDATKIGFDGTLKFEPQLGVFPDMFHDGFTFRRLFRNLKLGCLAGDLKVYEDSLTRSLMLQDKPAFQYVPSIYVGWDNSPRRHRNGIIFHNRNPDNFRHALECAYNTMRSRGDHEHIIFINAWNEWAEGNYLEPDLELGHEFLRVVKQVKTARKSGIHEAANATPGRVQHGKVANPGPRGMHSRRTSGMGIQRPPPRGLSPRSDD